MNFCLWSVSRVVLSLLANWRHRHFQNLKDKQDLTGFGHHHLLPWFSGSFTYPSLWGWFYSVKTLQIYRNINNQNLHHTPSLVGRAETQGGLVPLPQVVSRILEGYLSCIGSHWEELGLNLKLCSTAQGISTKKKHPCNIWLWKSVEICVPGRKREEAARNTGSLLKEQRTKSHF